MTFRAPENLSVAMEVLKDRDGIPLSEQMRRALVMFLEAKGVYAPHHKKPSAPRKRS